MSWLAVRRNWKELLVSKLPWLDPLVPLPVEVDVLVVVPVAVLMSVIVATGLPPDGELFVVRWYEATPFTCGSNAARLS